MPNVVNNAKFCKNLLQTRENMEPQLLANVYKESYVRWQAYSDNFGTANVLYFPNESVIKVHSLRFGVIATPLSRQSEQINAKIRFPYTLQSPQISIITKDHKFFK